MAQLSRMYSAPSVSSARGAAKQKNSSSRSSKRASRPSTEPGEETDELPYKRVLRKKGGTPSTYYGITQVAAFSNLYLSAIASIVNSNPKVVAVAASVKDGDAAGKGSSNRGKNKKKQTDSDINTDTAKGSAVNISNTSLFASQYRNLLDVSGGCVVSPVIMPLQLGVLPVAAESEPPSDASDTWYKSSHLEPSGTGADGNDHESLSLDETGLLGYSQDDSNNDNEEDHAFRWNNDDDDDNRNKNNHNKNGKSGSSSRVRKGKHATNHGHANINADRPIRDEDGVKRKVKLEDIRKFTLTRRLADHFNSSDFEALQSTIDLYVQEDCETFVHPGRATFHTRDALFNLWKSLFTAYPDGLFRLSDSTIDDQGRVVTRFFFSGVQIFNILIYGGGGYSPQSVHVSVSPRGDDCTGAQDTAVAVVAQGPDSPFTMTHRTSDMTTGLTRGTTHNRLQQTTVYGPSATTSTRGDPAGLEQEQTTRHRGLVSSSSSSSSGTTVAAAASAADIIAATTTTATIAATTTAAAILIDEQTHEEGYGGKEEEPILCIDSTSLLLNVEDLLTEDPEEQCFEGQIIVTYTQSMKVSRVEYYWRKPHADKPTATTTTGATTTTTARTTTNSSSSSSPSSLPNEMRSHANKKNGTTTADSVVNTLSLRSQIHSTADSTPNKGAAATAAASSRNSCQKSSHNTNGSTTVIRKSTSSASLSSYDFVANSSVA